MKYSKSKNITGGKRIIALVMLAFILVGGGALVLSRNNQTDSADSPGSTTTTETTPTSNNPLSDEELAARVKERNSSPITISPSEDKVVISEGTQDPTSKQVVVKTELYGQNWATCELTLTQGASTIRKTADVLFQSSFSSCLGFAVSAEEFPAGGMWSATLKGIKSNASSVISTSVQINVVK